MVYNLDHSFQVQSQANSRVHSQAWVRGDYSDVVVSLSSIYSTVRDDTAPEEARDASHSVVRSTSKYWVKTEDISKVNPNKPSFPEGKDKCI